MLFRSKLLFWHPGEFSFLGESLSQFFADCLADLLDQVPFHLQSHSFAFHWWLLLDVLAFDDDGFFARDGRSACHGVVAGLFDLFPGSLLLFRVLFMADLVPYWLLVPCLSVV